MNLNTFGIINTIKEVLYFRFWKYNYVFQYFLVESALSRWVSPTFVKVVVKKQEIKNSFPATLSLLMQIYGKSTKELTGNLLLDVIIIIKITLFSLSILQVYKVFASILQHTAQMFSQLALVFCQMWGSYSYLFIKCTITSLSNIGMLCRQELFF